MKNSRLPLLALALPLFGFFLSPAFADPPPAAAPLVAVDPPSFHDVAIPEGWTVTSGASATASLLLPRTTDLALKTTDALSLPCEATFRFQATGDDDLTPAVTIQATEDASGAPEATAQTPLLDMEFTPGANNNALIAVNADGREMRKNSDGSTGATGVPAPWLIYGWRYPKIDASWPRADRAEISADSADLVPFAQKTFTLRLLLTRTARQVWLDDRLVAEKREPGPAATHFYVSLGKGARMLSAQFAPASITWRWTPLSLGSYSHAATAQDPVAVTSLDLRLPGGDSLPVIKAPEGHEIDLGQSLYRFRNSAAAGPFKGRIDAAQAWPSPFTIDPAELNFRVPFRDYQNAWLVVWLDSVRGAVPRGEFRFYREGVGDPAGTPFAVDAAAIAAGLVTKLEFQTAAGRALYLVKVPLDTDALYGYGRHNDGFLDFALIKPAQPMRSYPAPTYYGSHPGGPPSSVHVAAITLETAPFHFEVQAGEYGHVFEAPEQPSYTVAVTNAIGQPLHGRVTFSTRSFDGLETTSSYDDIDVAPGATVNALFTPQLNKFGWHEVKTVVSLGGLQRQSTLSLVLLPHNNRTYANAVDETRFGAHILWDHGVPVSDPASSEPLLAMLRQLGIRRFNYDKRYVEPAIAKKYDLLAAGPHTDGLLYANVDANDPAALQKAVDSEMDELADLATAWPHVAYLYGDAWKLSREQSYGADPRYTGDGGQYLPPADIAETARQSKIYNAIGAAMRKRYPYVRLVLKNGSARSAVPFLRTDFPSDLINMFGMRLQGGLSLPEGSNTVDGINALWTLRQEAARLNYKQYPIDWSDGPYLPTNEGALSENEQADYLVRSWLMGLVQGVSEFSAAINLYDAGDSLGSEAIGAGVFHALGRENPKPAVAAIATATSMLCGSDLVGSLPTGNLSTYCLAFKRAATGGSIYALWRARGSVDAMLTVRGTHAPHLTDAMGNSIPLTVTKGALHATIGTSPVWLTGCGNVSAIQLGVPLYADAPAAQARALPAFTTSNWRYDGAADHDYASVNFGVRRVADPKLTANFGAGEAAHPQAVSITLAVEPGNRPLANRYGALAPRQPCLIPGAPSALGVWIKGNASWGRIAYQLRDAKGELWTSTGPQDEFAGDDPRGLSSINFEGWRYARFPLPGNLAYDTARTLESTWWGSRNGDGIVDYPLTLERIYVEARNEVPYLGKMALVPDRTYQLAGLVAEYNTAADATPAAVMRHDRRMIEPMMR